jgi:hypothetical protein
MMDLNAKLYDLGQPYFPGMPHYPTHPPFLYSLTKKHGDIFTAMAPHRQPMPSPSEPQIVNEKVDFPVQVPKYGAPPVYALRAPFPLLNQNVEFFLNSIQPSLQSQFFFVDAL